MYGSKSSIWSVHVSTLSTEDFQQSGSQMIHCVGEFSLGDGANDCLDLFLQFLEICEPLATEMGLYPVEEPVV